MEDACNVTDAMIWMKAKAIYKQSMNSLSCAFRLLNITEKKIARFFQNLFHGERAFAFTLKFRVNLFIKFFR